MTQLTTVAENITTPVAIFSARDLRNRSGDLLRGAESGQLALVTKHGRPAFLAIPFTERLLLEGVHRSLALTLFEAGQITLGHGAKLAGLSTEGFIELLGDTGTPAASYPPEEIDDELERAL